MVDASRSAGVMKPILVRDNVHVGILKHDSEVRRTFARRQ